jgi:hypothetical protein
MRTRVLSSIICVLAAAPAARANLAQSRPYPAVIGDVGASAPSALRVTGEQLTFSCSDERGRPLCRFEALYTFRNQTSSPAAADAVFLGVDAGELRVTQDGRPIGRELDASMQRTVDATLARGERRPGTQLTSAGLRIALERGRTARVSVAGRIAPGRYFQAGYDIPLPRTRHMLLGASPPRSNTFHLEYLISPIRSWGSPAPEIAVSVSYPRAWKLSVRATGGPTERPDATRANAGRRRVVESFRVAGQSVDKLWLEIQAPPPLPFHGGPFAGVGGNLDDSGGLRARFGYEIAAPEWLLLSLAVDTNFRDDVVLAPGVEAASRSFAGIIPSVGLGLGLPVRLVEERRVGLRVQLTVHWPILGWITCFDVYPGRGFSEPRRFQVGMLAQIGL